MLHGSVWIVLVPRFDDFGKGPTEFRRLHGAVRRVAAAQNIFVNITRLTEI